MENQNYLVVDEVKAGSEAERVGIKKGDLISEYDGLKITDDLFYFLSLITKTEGRDQVVMKVLRNNEHVILNVKGGKLGINISPAKNAVSVDYEFKTLLGYGKFISSFGWVVVIVGAIAFMMGFANMRSFGVMAILGGIITLIMGIGLVANGQLISCFVSIERNTRKTSQLLESRK